MHTSKSEVVPAAGQLSPNAKELLSYMCALGTGSLIVYAPSFRYPYCLLPPNFNRNNGSTLARIKHPEELRTLEKRGFLKAIRRSKGDIRTIFLLTERGRVEGAGIEARLS